MTTKKDVPPVLQPLMTNNAAAIAAATAYSARYNKVFAGVEDFLRTLGLGDEVERELDVASEWLFGFGAVAPGVNGLYLRSRAAHGSTRRRLQDTPIALRYQAAGALPRLLSLIADAVSVVAAHSEFHERALAVLEPRTKSVT